MCIVIPLFTAPDAGHVPTLTEDVDDDDVPGKTLVQSTLESCYVKPPGTSKAGSRCAGFEISRVK